MKLSDWLKTITKPENLKKLNLSKKTIINLIIVFCIGITFLIVSDFYRDLNIKENNNPGQQIRDADQYYDNQNNENDTKSSDSYVRELENQLAGILSKIEKAGKVSVMITLKSSSEKIPAKDESVSDKVTNEKDTEGGTRVINESNTNEKVVFHNTQGGSSEALIIKEINPDIKGVIVVAEGAKDPKIKLKLTQAVETVLDIPAYRVMVYERE